MCIGCALLLAMTGLIMRTIRSILLQPVATNRGTFGFLIAPSTCTTAGVAILPHLEPTEVTGALGAGSTVAVCTSK